MSLGHSPRVVTDSLIYYVDPGNTASAKDMSANVHPNPLDIYAWFALTGGTNNCVVSRETGFTSPAGGIPLKMVPTGNDSHIGTYNNPVYNLAPTYIGDTWTVSVWARADKPTTGQIFIFGSYNNGSSFYEAPATTINITTEWQRFSYTRTMVNAGSVIIQTRLDGADTFDGATIWWDGLMVEKSSSMSDFVTSKSTTLLDLTANSYNSALTNGASYIRENSGVIGFDGFNDTVVTPLNLTSISRLKSWTLSCWMRFDNLPGAPQATINNNGVIFGAASYGGAAIYWTNLDGLTYRVYGYVRGADNSWTTNYHTPTLRTYTHYVAVNNIAANQLQFYVNGNLFASTTYTTTPQEYTSAAIADAGNIAINKNQISGGGTQNYRYFNGKVGATSIYSRALSTNEVRQNFDALRGRYGV